MVSLRQKFLAVSLLTHVLVIVAMLAVLARLAGAALHEQLERQTQHVGALLSPALAPMIVARDYAAAEELLQDLTVGGTLVYARLFDNSGKQRLAVGTATADLLPADLASRAPLLLQGIYNGEQTLSLGDRPQGRVRYGIAVNALATLHQRLFGWFLAIGTGGLLLAGTLQWLLSRQLTRRLEHLAGAADRLAAGEPDLALDASGQDEAARLADSFNRMAATLRQRFEDLRRSQAQLEEAGHALESKVAERTVALQQARDEAERASKAKSDFLSRMSHELRTPLNAILGFAQLLRLPKGPQDPSDSTSREQLAHIERAGWHLLELIDEVLDLSRIETGTLVVSDDSVALAPLIAEALNMVRPQARQLGLELRDDSSAIADVQVQADATRLRQVLVNLLSNACKYNRPAGSVTVSARALGPEVIGSGSAGSGQEGSAVEIAVSDTGIGLSSDQLASLYEPFNRLGAEATATEGTGIGLVITRRLVELMHGRISVESSPGIGSTFRVTLRRSERAVGRPPDPPPMTVPASTRMVLLYVEDNPSNIDVMKALVQHRPGVELRLACDGPEGLRQAMAGGIDAAVVDIALPGMDGVGVCRRLRALPGWAGRSIVALSANAMPQEVRRGMEAGFDRYFTKPLAVQDFLCWLDEQLQHHHDPMHHDHD